MPVEEFIKAGNQHVFVGIWPRGAIPLEKVAAVVEHWGGETALEQARDVEGRANADDLRRTSGPVVETAQLAFVMGHSFDVGPFRNAGRSAVVVGGEHGRAPFVIGCAADLSSAAYRLALTRRGSPLPVVINGGLALSGSAPRLGRRRVARSRDTAIRARRSRLSADPPCRPRFPR